MIEQSIYFALGCVVTALCALMFAPIFWSRALRLSRQRLQLQIPLSMQEIYAERDGLRAEFAVERLRIEQELERVQSGKARDLAEIGRRSMESARLAEDLATVKRSERALGTTIEDLQRQLADRDASIARLEGELRASHDLVEGLRDAEQAAAAKVAAEKVELEAARAAAAKLAQERHSALEQELAGAQLALATAREREKSVYLESSMKAEQARSVDRTTAGRLELLEAENAVLQSALTDAKRSTRGPLDLEGSGLRESIHDLGLKVAEMAREGRSQGASAPSKDEVQPVD